MRILTGISNHRRESLGGGTSSGKNLAFYLEEENRLVNKKGKNGDYFARSGFVKHKGQEKWIRSACDRHSECDGMDKYQVEERTVHAVKNLWGTT